MHTPPSRRKAITQVSDDWTLRLADAIAAAIREFAPMLGDEAIALLAIDCHPWHGSLGLSALTAAEVDADGLLADPSEMAAWRHHYFTRDLAAWQSTANLGSEMRAAYASGDRSAMAEEFLAACAAAMASESVVAAIEKLNLVRGFRVSVTHPDTGRDFSKSQQKFFGEQD